jgi:hypothetical protein
MWREGRHGIIYWCSTSVCSECTVILHGHSLHLAWWPPYMDTTHPRAPSGALVVSKIFHHWHPLRIHSPASILFSFTSAGILQIMISLELNSCSVVVFSSSGLLQGTWSLGLNSCRGTGLPSAGVLTACLTLGPCRACSPTPNYSIAQRQTDSLDTLKADFQHLSESILVTTSPSRGHDFDFFQWSLDFSTGEEALLWVPCFSVRDTKCLLLLVLKNSLTFHNPILYHSNSMLIILRKTFLVQITL